MKAETFHLSARIDWLLGKGDEAFGQMFLKADKTHLTAKEAKLYLKGLLAEGKKLLPIGQPCDGFSYTTGCPGHPNEVPSEDPPAVPKPKDEDPPPA